MALGGRQIVVSGDHLVEYGTSSSRGSDAVESRMVDGLAAKFFSGKCRLMLIYKLQSAIYSVWSCSRGIRTVRSPDDFEGDVEICRGSDFGCRCLMRWGIGGQGGAAAWHRPGSATDRNCTVRGV